MNDNVRQEFKQINKSLCNELIRDRVKYNECDASQYEPFEQAFPIANTFELLDRCNLTLPKYLEKKITSSLNYANLLKLSYNGFHKYLEYESDINYILCFEDYDINKPYDTFDFWLKNIKNKTRINKYIKRCRNREHFKINYDNTNEEQKELLYIIEQIKNNYIRN
jgi:hypothetical protein